MFKTDGHVHPGWLGGQCKKAGIPEDVGFRFVADLARIFGLTVHSKYHDSLTEAATPAAIERSWSAVSDRIEDLAQEITEHMD